MNSNKKGYRYRIKPRYSDTDGYGIMHNACYYSWFDEARISLAENTGLSMQLLEDNGIRMPVIENGCKYKSAIKYGDILDIYVEITLCKSAKWIIRYKIVNAETNVIHAEGYTINIYVNKENKILLEHPKWILDKVYNCIDHNRGITYFKMEK